MRVNGSSTGRQSKHPRRSIEEIVDIPTPLTNQVPRQEKAPRYSSNNVHKTFHQPHDSKTRSFYSKDVRREQISQLEPRKVHTTAALAGDGGSTKDCSGRTRSLTGSKERVQAHSFNESHRGPMSERTHYHPQRPLRRSRNEMGSLGRLTPDTLPSSPSTNSTSSISPESNRKRASRRYSRTGWSREAGRSDRRSPSDKLAREREVDDRRKRDRYTGREESSLLQEGIRTCLRTGKTVGLKVSECLGTSADMYQQEYATKHLHRGDDFLFLTHKERCTHDAMGADASDSRIGGTPTETTGIMSDVFRKSELGDLLKEGLIQSPNDAHSTGDGDGDHTILHQPPNHVKQELGDDLHVLPQTFHTTMVDEFADEFVDLRALRLSMFNQDSRLTRQDEGISAFATTQSTLRVGAGMVQRTQHVEKNDQSQESTNSPTMQDRPDGLHDLQQRDLQDQESQGSKEPQGPCVSGEMDVEVQEDDFIRSQQGTISTLEKELSRTKKALKQAVEALDQRGCFVKQEAVQVSAEKLFRERVDVEEKLRKEMRLKDELSDKVQDLEEEMKILRLSLQHAKETARQAAMHDIAKSSNTARNAAENKDSDHNDPTLAAVRSASQRTESAADRIRESRRQLLRKKELRLSKLVETLRRENSDEEPRLGSDRETSSPTSVMETETMVSSSSKNALALSDVHKTPYSDVEAQIMSMKAEVVALRGQVAEAHAARLSAEKRASSLEVHNVVLRDEKHQMEDRRAELRNIVDDLNKKKIIRVVETSVDEANQLRKTLREMEEHRLAGAEEQSTMEKEVSRGEIEIESLRENANYSNEEMNSIKENLQKDAAADRAEKMKKVEEDLSNSKREAELLRRGVARLANELERERMSSDARHRVSEEEARILQDEVQQIKEKLAKRNEDIANQADEHLAQLRGMEKKLEENKRITEALQQKVAVLDSEVATKETEIETLRVLLEKRMNLNFRT